jgi:hypothetical protein
MGLLGIQLSVPSFILDIASNIIANVVFWLAGGLTVAYVVGWKRRKLVDFFGLGKQNRLLVYMTSRPVYEPFDERGIPSEEFQLVPTISSLFLSSQLGPIPEAFSGLIDSFWLIKRPSIEFLASPQDAEDIRFANTICVGGPAYNTATAYYSKACSPYFALSHAGDGWRAHILRGTRAGESVTADEGWDLGILNKCYDVEHGTTIFIVAGIGINGTIAAAEHLVSNWQTLQTAYKAEEFGLYLRCPYRTSNDLTGYEMAEVMMQLP